MNKRPFAINIRRARLARMWSQETAARKIGITRASLGAYEEDRAEPSFAVLLKIMEVYHIKDAKQFIDNPDYLTVNC